MNLEHGGKVTSHLVKYSHHVDGRAHFSQDGKIFTTIKRQSVALEKQDGHIFSLLIQGLNALDPAQDDLQSSNHAAIEFAMEPPAAVKFVGRWFDVNAMRFSNPTTTIGPVVPGLDPDGKRGTRFLQPALMPMRAMSSQSAAFPSRRSVLSRRFFCFTADSRPGTS